ncbi:MAG: BadF/BadG/BcrA/BcrD ATPase family protein [Candidatus Aenigmatarchaeota archaeon]
MKNNKSLVFVGIDGGATKTKLIAIDENERILLRICGEGSNYKALGLDLAEKNLYKLLSKCLRKLNKINGICFGLASIDSENDKKIVLERIKKGKIGKLLGKEVKIILLNDTEIILSAANLENGVAVIGGTGSNFLGVNKDKKAWAGGLEYILADEGSAFDIGQRVLRAALRSYDGRGRKTLLEKLVMKKARIRNMREIKDVVYKEKMKSIVASFAPLAEIAAEKGDAIAKKILKDCAKEYIIGIKAVAKKVKLKGDFKIVLVGSVFNSKIIFNELNKIFRNRIIRLKDPSIGAARIAKKIYFENLENNKR